MCEEGCVDGVDEIYFAHSSGFMDFGGISSVLGPMQAGITSFKVEIQGKGGHSAWPHLSASPVPAATSCIR